MEVKTMTSTARAATIHAELAKMLSRLPEGWQGWSADRTAQFKADCKASMGANSIPKLPPIASRLAGVYGRDMATIDPCHGQA